MVKSVQTQDLQSNNINGLVGQFADSVVSRSAQCGILSDFDVFMPSLGWATC